MGNVTLYKSSAGSGKTFTLSREYINLAIHDPSRFRKILAITFTNEAAFEMKERIINTLTNLVKGIDNDLANTIINDVGDAETAREKASELLQRILHDYNRFSVTTIDSFFSSVIRPFSRELNLPVNYEIQLDEPYVLDVITGKLLDKCAGDEALKKFLVNYIHNNIKQGKSWYIEKDLHKLAGEVLKEATMGTKPVSFSETEAFAAELNAIRHNFRDQMDSFGKKGIKTMEQFGATLDDFKYKKSGALNYFNKIQKGHPKQDYIPGNRVFKVLNEEDALVANGASENISEAANALLSLLDETCEYFEANHQKFYTAEAILKNIHAFGLWQEFRNNINAYKKKHNIILISDLNRIIHNELLKEPVPYIYSKAGVRFNYFFIDEFQDTSGMQWKNLLPLLENAVSEGGMAFFVGDTKQAIYRWRGGDPSIMEQEAAEQFPGQVNHQNLQFNYRSLEHIVNFNNMFFLKCGELLKQYAPASIGDKVFDESLNQQVPEFNKNSGGYIELHFPAQHRSNDITNEACHEIVKNTLKQLTEDGYNYDDIVFIVRSNKEANEIATFLLEQNYPALSENALYLENAPVVRFLLSTLTHLTDPSNELAHIEAAWLYQHYLNKTNENNPADDKAAILKNLPGILQENLHALRRMHLYEATESIINLCSLHENNTAYLASFMNVVYDYTQKETPSIHAFLEWWQNGKHTVNTGSGKGVIRIYTVHKCKGLEFPAVILPYTNWKFPPRHTDLVWMKTDQGPFNQFGKVPVNPVKVLDNSYFRAEYEKEIHQLIHDNINMMYVAFTRARERLTIIAPLAEKHDPATSAASWIAETLKEHDVTQGSVVTYGSREHRQKASKDTSEPEQIHYNREIHDPVNIKSRYQLLPEVEFKLTGEALHEGKALHELMAMIRYKKDTEPALHDFRRKHPGFDTQRLRKKLDALFLQSSTNEWLPASPDALQAGEYIKTETSLLLPGGKELRPDRVVIKKNKTFIIDFKTGKPETGHALQIEQYANVLLEMGYQNIVKKLVYLGDEVEVRSV